MKKYILVFIFTTICFNSFAVVVDGVCYKLSESTNTASVTYSSSEDGENYVGKRNIVIPATIQYNGKTYEVTSISEYAFQGCPDLETIEIGKNIKRIAPGRWTRVFADSPNLNKVIWRAKNCQEGFADYYTPFGYQGDYFWQDGGCTKIKTIEFTDDVETIPDYFSLEMINLDTIRLGKNIISIGRSNLEYFKNVYISDLEAFCRITNYPSDKFYIGFKLFLNNQEINDLIIPESVKNIHDFTFQGCSSIKSLQLTKNITNIEKNAFKYCTNLSTVTFAAASCEDLENTIFDNNSIKNITFSENVKHIPSHICNNQPIQSITIPSNVETIGANAFFGCSQISHIYWNAINCSVIDNGVFNSSATNISFFSFGDEVEEVPHHICYNMSKLTSITLPNGVLKINNSAFERCSNLTSISIPHTVTTLGESAFSGCTAWRVVLPNSLKYIGKNALYNTFTYNLDRSWIDNVLYVENYLIKCKETNNVSSYSIKEGTTVIADAAFESITSLSSVNIPNSITHIGNKAFYNCQDIVSINIPKNIESIGEYAMYISYQKESPLGGALLLPATLKHIGNYAFYKWKKSSIYAQMQNPPSITSTTFGLARTVTNTPVYVYHDNVNSYYQANVWKQFDIISAYKVVFTDENGVIIEEQMVCHGENATPPQMPNQEGYQFVGWDKSYTNITNDIVIKAIYKPAKYKVIFYDYDYTVLKSDSVLYGNNAIPPKDPIRHGYIFIGWDKDYSNVKSDLNIIAKYEQDIIYYTVTFLDWDGIELHVEQVEEGKDAVGPATNPTREGYIFIGWDKDYSNVKSDLNIIAKYEQDIIYYTVTFLDWDGTELHVEQVEEGKDAVGLATNPTREGYIFIGWSKPITNITSNLTVIALYEEASAVDDVETQDSAIRKVIENQLLRIILPNGKTYNVMGQEVK